MSERVNASPKNVLIPVDFSVFLYLNMISLYIYLLGVIAILFLRRCPRMDPKAWWNMGVYICSFGVKTIAWIVIFHSTDKEKLNNIDYASKLWYEEAHWFLFDYFAAYAIKMSIYVFIFEMR